MSNRSSYVRGAAGALGLSCLLCVLAFTGCDSGVGPLTPVQGKVLVDGKPLAAGDVKFFAVDASGPKAIITGTVGSDGQYTMSTNGKPGAPKGKFKVTVNTMASGPAAGAADPSKMTAGPVAVGAPQRLANSKYETPEKTDLTVEVPSSSYDLNLTK